MSAQLIMHTKAPLNSESIRGASTSRVRFSIFSGRQATSREATNKPADNQPIANTTQITTRSHAKHYLHELDVCSNKQRGHHQSPSGVCLNKHPRPAQPSIALVQTNTGTAQAIQGSPSVCLNKHDGAASGTAHHKREALDVCSNKQEGRHQPPFGVCLNKHPRLTQPSIVFVQTNIVTACLCASGSGQIVCSNKRLGMRGMPHQPGGPMNNR